MSATVQQPVYSPNILSILDIRRRFPRTEEGRYQALRTAKAQHLNTGNGTVLTATTAARLLAIEAGYEAAKLAVTVARAGSFNATLIKNEDMASCGLYANHALANIIMAVKRGEIPKAYLNLYSMDENRPRLPVAKSEQQVVLAAEFFVKGEESRLAIGGTPLPLPSAQQVQAKLDKLDASLNAQNTAQQILRVKQGELKQLEQEANAVIKKIWDEVNTFYNELPDETRRSFCRLWGVIYTSNTRIPVSGILLEMAGNKVSAVKKFTVRLVQTDELTKAKSNGLFVLHTHFNGLAAFIIESEGKKTIHIEKEISGKEPVNLGELLMEDE